MKKAIFIFPLFFLFALLPAAAQKQGQELIDSLQTVLVKSGQDTNKVNVLNRLSSSAGWQVGNYDTAAHYARAALQLARNLDFKSGMAGAYNNIGLAYFYQGNYPQALKNYQSSLGIAGEIADKNGIAAAYGNIGIVYKNQGNYPEALKSFFAGLKICEAMADKRGIANACLNIGNIYQAQGNYPEALKSHQASLKIAKEIDFKRGIANAYNNIGSAYANQGNYAEALKNFIASLNIRKLIGDKAGIAGAYGNIGGIYSDQGNYTESLKNYLAGLKIAEEVGDKLGTAWACNNIGNVYLRLGEAENAKTWLNKGLQLSREIGAKAGIKSAYEQLASADSFLGNYKAAFTYRGRYMLYKDSLYNEENAKKLTRSAMQYEFDKKQLADSIKNITAQNRITKRLQQQKTYTWSGIGAGAFLLALLLSIYRSNKKLTTEKQKSESLLLNILPEEIAAELKENGHAEARQFDEVTVLFTDFVNFTGISEQMNPAELVAEIHKNFTAFDTVMEQYGLEKIKTIGDAYMAVCGLPNETADHAQRVVKAAIAIRAFVTEHNSKFQIRIGIHSGSVVAGIVGVKKFAYDIWGDTVNTAARMEQSGEAGKINISETTHELVKDDFECTYRGEVEAKGKGKMKMYFVNG